MRKKKAGVYPFTEAFIPNLCYKSLLEGIEVSLLIDYSGKILDSREIIEKSAYAKEKKSIDWQLYNQNEKIETLIVTDDANDLELSGILSVIEQFCVRGVEIITLRLHPVLEDKISSLCKQYDVSYKNEKSVSDNGKIDYMNMKYSLSLCEIGVPIISVMGVCPNTQRHEIQLNILSELKKDGYKATLVGTGQLLELMGQYSIKDVMDRNLPEVHKIYYFNNFIGEIEKRESPDVIIIGVDDPIVSFSKTHMFNFGIFASEIFSAVTPDISIITLINGEYNDDLYQSMRDMCRYKYNLDADSFFVSRYVPISASMTREKLSYTYSEEVNAESENFKIFIEQDIENRNIYDYIKTKLLQYGRYEQF